MILNEKYITPPPLQLLFINSLESLIAWILPENGAYSRVLLLQTLYSWYIFSINDYSVDQVDYLNIFNIYFMPVLKT